MALDMIQFLYLLKKEINIWSNEVPKVKYKIDHRYKAFGKIKKFF